MKKNDMPVDSSIKLLKKTKSICPKCMKVIDASVFEKKDGVWMYKECDEHGKFKGMVEKDAEFYKKTMNEYPAKRNENIGILLIPFTHKCNLNCNFCWLPQKNRDDFSLEYLKGVISNSNCINVRISGGEPTLRNDLPDLIRFIKKNNKISIIVTNGLRLVDLDYVKKLKDAGLDVVCLSFNSFDDEVYKKLNGKKLLKVKLKALENLKKLNIPTVLSVMVVRGTNDKELKDFLNICVNNSFIFELRIRSSAPLGKYVESDGFFVSEIISEFSKILKVDREKFMNSIDKNRHMPCSFTSILTFSKQDGNMDRGNVRILKLQLRSWPNKYNIDLGDMEMCPTCQLSKNGEFPFCYSLILNNENVIEL